MGQCPPLGSLLNVVPSVLWTATNPDVNLNLSVGSTFNFFCPPDLQVRGSFTRKGILKPLGNFYGEKSLAVVCSIITWNYLYNKTGLQPVSKPVEQVPLLTGLGPWGWVQSLFGAMAEQTDKQTGLAVPLSLLKFGGKAEQKDIQIDRGIKKCIVDDMNNKI